MRNKLAFLRHQHGSVSLPILCAVFLHTHTLTHTHHSKAEPEINFLSFSRANHLQFCSLLHFQTIFKHNFLYIFTFFALVFVKNTFWPFWSIQISRVCVCEGKLHTKCEDSHYHVGGVKKASLFLKTEKYYQCSAKTT